MSAHSGKTTRSQPCDAACRSIAIIRATALARLSLRAMGPSCAAPTVTMRVIQGASCSASALASRTKSATESVSPRTAGSTPAASSSVAAQIADSALRIVLAPLAERRTDDATEQGGVGDVRFGVRQWSQADDRGIHLGRRPKRSRRDDEKPCRPELRLQHHGEPPVLGSGGPGRHPRDHFLLQHHVHVDEPRAELREAKKQRRADVVRKIADHTQRPAEPREVEVEHVGDVERQLLGV